MSSSPNKGAFMSEGESWRGLEQAGDGKGEKESSEDGAKAGGKGESRS